MKPLKKFEQYDSPWEDDDESYYNDDDYLFGRPNYPKNKPESKDEFDDEMVEDIEQLKDLLITYFQNQGVEIEVENKGFDITFFTYLNKVEKIKNIIKVFNIVKKVKKDILTQYESEFELWETQDKSPVLHFSFYYDDKLENDKPF